MRRVGGSCLTSFNVLPVRGFLGSDFSHSFTCRSSSSIARRAKNTLYECMMATLALSVLACATWPVSVQTGARSGELVTMPTPPILLIDRVVEPGMGTVPAVIGMPSRRWNVPGSMPSIICAIAGSARAWGSVASSADAMLVSVFQVEPGVLSIVSSCHDAIIVGSLVGCEIW